jgi:hypothetical protein
VPGYFESWPTIGRDRAGSHGELTCRKRFAW